MSERSASSTVITKRAEQAALLLAAAGTGVAWIIPYIFSDVEIPTWVVSRWYLLVCAPAMLGGLVAFWRCGGFAKAPPVIATVALVVAGISWTDPTELGRAALLAASILVPLPLAALIRKHDYLEPFLRAFSITTAASLIYAFTSAGSDLTGRLVDSKGTSLTNPNSVGLQAALATLVLLMTVPRRKGLGSYLLILLATVLAISCVTTGSRTAFLALAASFLVSLLLLHNRFALPLMLGILITLTALGLNAIVDREHPFYQRIFERLIQDDEDTRDTFGDRTEIWRVAAQEFTQDNTWLRGTGTGGVDKAIGSSSELNGGAVGEDGILRLSAHNTFVWCALAFGISGVAAFLWLGFSAARTAYKLDRETGDWRRLTMVTFVVLGGFGGVITQEYFWCALAAALLAMLSPEAFGQTPRLRLSHFNLHSSGPARIPDAVPGVVGSLHVRSLQDVRSLQE